MKQLLHDLGINLGLISASVYVVSWIGWFDSSQGWDRGKSALLFIALEEGEYSCLATDT